MGQYRLSLKATLQFGILLRMDADFYEIHLPFLSILIGRQEDAYGTYFFGKEIN